MHCWIIQNIYVQFLKNRLHRYKTACSKSNIFSRVPLILANTYTLMTTTSFKKIKTSIPRSFPHAPFNKSHLCLVHGNHCFPFNHRLVCLWLMPHNASWAVFRCVWLPLSRMKFQRVISDLLISALSLLTVQQQFMVWLYYFVFSPADIKWSHPSYCFFMNEVVLHIHAQVSVVYVYTLLFTLSKCLRVPLSSHMAIVSLILQEIVQYILLRRQFFLY